MRLCPQTAVVFGSNPNPPTGREQAVGQLPNPPMITGKSLLSKNHVARALWPKRKHTTSRKCGVHFQVQCVNSWQL